MLNPCDPSQWQVGFNAGKELLACLYVRDRYGLAPSFSPGIPPLAPEVTSQPVEPASRLIMGEQWAGWWAERLAVPSADPEGEELRAAVERAAAEARAWSAERYREFVQISRVNNSSPRELVTAMDGRGPLNRSVCCLPLSEKRAWRLSPGSAIVSYSFYADWAGCVAWLSALPGR